MGAELAEPVVSGVGDRQPGLGKEIPVARVGQVIWPTRCLPFSQHLGGCGMAESDKVINAVIEATGESYEKVSPFCSIAHETVDECVTDDISVVAPPLVIGRLGCPVLDRLL